MAPKPEEDRHESSLGIEYPIYRDDSPKTSDKWLDGKRLQDGAEGFWRVHDEIYDLTDFIPRHPGGKFWLEITKGTDVTEAFEAHHISLAPEKMLKKFSIGKAKTPRNSPFTFKEDGFYRTMKRNVREALEKAPKKPVTLTAVMTDSLLVGMFIFSILACAYWSYLLGIVAGFFLCWTTIASHNYFHQKDNFRMHYFNFSFLQTREWRISHALSHHLYTNTILDLEISMFEPILEYMPKEKSFTKRYLSWFYSPILVWVTLFYFSFFKLVYHFLVMGQTKHLQRTDLIPFMLPLTMYWVTGQPLLSAVGMWLFIVLVGSTVFGFIGLNAAHHHPDIFHDGDTPRPVEQRDWGIGQLDAVMDRHEITGSHFLVLTNFGDHALHHFFPTLDHGTLAYLYPVVEKTMKQFNVKIRMKSQLELVKGQFTQLARNQPNKNPPNLFKK